MFHLNQTSVILQCTYSYIRVNIHVHWPCPRPGCGNKEEDSPGCLYLYPDQASLLSLWSMTESIDYGFFNSVNGLRLQEPDLMAQRLYCHRQSVSNFIWLRSPVKGIITWSLRRHGCPICFSWKKLTTRQQTHIFFLLLPSLWLSYHLFSKMSFSKIPCNLVYTRCLHIFTHRSLNIPITHGWQRKTVINNILVSTSFSFNITDNHFFRIKDQIVSFICSLTLYHEYLCIFSPLKNVNAYTGHQPMNGPLLFHLTFLNLGL